MSDLKNTTVATLAFISGAVCASLVQSWSAKKKNNTFKRDAGATIENNDLSMYWGDPSKYIPAIIPEQRRFLPAEFYREMCHNCIICCCDILLVRNNPVTKSKECLLVERASEPVKGSWWWPGGRMFKGETFFDAALRKMKDEVGIEIDLKNCAKYGDSGSDNIDDKKKVLLQVMGVYNTFFPTSAWDTEKDKGTQTVNSIVLIVLPDSDDQKHDVLLDKTSERFKWISLDADDAEKNGEEIYVVEGLRRLSAWNNTCGKLWS